LGSYSLREADRLEHRVGIRQSNDASDFDIQRIQADPFDRHRIAGRDVEIGRGLCPNQHTVP
jgi:hypothetical protein